MAVPKKKTSKSKRNMRRSHHALTVPSNIHNCPQCNEPVQLHHVCGECGFYKGKEAVQIPID